ncbi:AraC family transcriptional regulator [Paenibacillus sp. IB182496]|uniref:AraC family transcriptional regulator n=1 Tax=Paenibacillus sabuli TaxID=2772509 RepID=A0A927BPX5_9BACL|nr:AraC family transcriptional regulator [Paenibacillus sabuli]MBD2844557.1 AraC family transcriptional regulator [Paenibacillus sabuli]
MRTKRSVFAQFFISYFLLFLVPVIVVGIFTYVYLTRAAEQEAEASASQWLTHYAESVDEQLALLQEDMIQTVESASIGTYLRLAREGDLARNPDRVPLLQELMRQLYQTYDDKPAIGHAYLLFASTGKVLDANGYYEAEAYFRTHNRIEDASGEFGDPMSSDTAKQALFTGRRLQYILPATEIGVYDAFLGTLQSRERRVMVITGFPLHARDPDGYLVVNLREDKLREGMLPVEQASRHIVVLGEDGQIITQGGALGEAAAALLRNNVNRELTDLLGQPGEIELDGRLYRLQSIASGYNGWTYASLLDLEALHYPMTVITRVFGGLLLLFLIAGLLIAYGFSRRMYRPIRTIRQRLDHLPGSPVGEGDNDYDVITERSQALITNNRSMHQQIDGMRPMIQEHFLSRVLLGEYKDDLAISIYAREIGLRLPERTRHEVLAVELRYHGDAAASLSETAKAFQIIELKHAILRMLAGAGWVCQVEPRRLAVIAEPCSSDADGSEQSGGRSVWGTRLLQAAEAFQPYFKATIAESGAAVRPALLSRAYDEASKLLEKRRLGRLHERIAPSDGDSDHGSRESCLTQSEVNRVALSVQGRDASATAALVAQLLDEALLRGLSAPEAQSWGLDCINTLIRSCGGAQRADFALERCRLWYDRLQQCGDQSELASLLKEVCQALVRSPQDDAARPGMFDEVLTHIHANYDKDLTLEHYAAQYGMSMGHFSRSFKEAVGEKYIDYLTRYRLRKAKDMLLSTDMRIDDISAAVGYVGRNSFINLFKKFEGLTPGKYRSLHQGGKPGTAGQAERSAWRNGGETYDGA